MRIMVAIYFAAILLANLLASMFGPVITPINAFFLIGLDLSLRNYFQQRMHKWQMGLLIGSTGVATYLLNPTAGMIAVASSCSFTAAALVDWAVFSKITGSFVRRSSISNLFGAAVDSVLFPTIAFGSIMPTIVIGQFAAKVIGGLFWSVAITKAEAV